MCVYCIDPNQIFFLLCLYFPPPSPLTPPPSPLPPHNRIIVGSPNGTFPGGLSFSGVNDSQVVNNTGLVYMCPITPGDCESLSGNEMGNDIRLFDYEGYQLVK